MASSKLGKVFAAEIELHLYIAILLELDDFDEAVKVVNGDLGSLLTNEVEKALMICELYKKLENWTALKDLCESQIVDKKLIGGYPRSDDWMLFAHYYEALKNINQLYIMFNQGQMKSFSRRSRPRMIETLCSQLSKQALSFLNVMVSNCAVANDKLSNLKGYIDSFGAKEICFYDIKNYLALLSSQEAEQLLSNFMVEVFLS